VRSRAWWWEYAGLNWLAGVPVKEIIGQAPDFDRATLVLKRYKQLDTVWEIGKVATLPSVDKNGNVLTS
jgi:hypothetical protein